jgi:hypothetical protein
MVESTPPLECDLMLALMEHLNAGMACNYAKFGARSNSVAIPSHGGTRNVVVFYLQDAGIHMRSHASDHANEKKIGLEREDCFAVCAQFARTAMGTWNRYCRRKCLDRRYLFDLSRPDPT